MSLLLVLTCDQILNRNLYYPSYATVPPSVQAQVVAPPTTAAWLRPFDGPPRVCQRLAGGQPFVPKEATRDNTVTPEKWLLRFGEMARYGVPGMRPSMPFVPREAVLDNTVTPDKWLLPFQASKPTRPVYTQPVYAAVTPLVDNTITPDKWLQRFDPAPKRQVWHTPISFPAYPYVQVVSVDYGGPSLPDVRAVFKRLTQYQSFAYPIFAPADNNITGAAWLQPWQGPQRRLLGSPGGAPFVPKEAVLENTQTPDTWQQPFQAAKLAARPVYTQPIYAAIIPFVSNTVTPDNWMRPFDQAVPRSPVRHTQPLLGYPYVSADNNITPDKWLQRFDPAPKRRVWHTPISFPAYPYAFDNTVTPDNWLLRWDAPPRYLLRFQTGQPFIPKEATVDNTVTPDKWLQRFDPAPKRRVWHTPISFPAYPYVQVVSVDYGGPALPDVRAVFKRLTQYQSFAYPIFAPFVSNTVTPDNWMRGFDRAVARPPVTRTQPFFGYPYISADNTVTPDKWLLPFQSARSKRPVDSQVLYPVVPVVVVTNTVTPDNWMLRWTGPLAYRPVHTQPTFLQRLPYFISQSVTAEIELTVNLHICGWGTEAEEAEGWLGEDQQADAWSEAGAQTDAASEESEQTDVFDEQAESDDDYDEKDECGR